MMMIDFCNKRGGIFSKNAVSISGPENLKLRLRERMATAGC